MPRLTAVWMLLGPHWLRRRCAAKYVLMLGQVEIEKCKKVKGEKEGKRCLAGEEEWRVVGVSLRVEGE